MSQLIDDVIRVSIANQYVYSKAQFDNAKDTRDLLFAAEENAKLLMSAVEYRLAQRVDQLLLERLEKALEHGKMVVRIGGKLYGIEEKQDV